MALITKATATPAVATSNPPSAGPTLRAKLNPALFSIVAAGMSRRGTMSETDDCQAGLFSAVPHPIRNVKVKSSQGPIRPSHAETASATDTANMKLWAVSMTRRLLSFADRHKIYLAFHGHAEYDNPDEFSTPATFQQALDMSKYAKINLDIGHFTAANENPVTYIEQHHDRISHLHMKDRKKNKGDNVEWGKGDTPIKEVLVLLRDKKYPIPAFIEYEYKGTGTSVAEVKKCMAYMKQALA